jgi:polypeptide N-acetylgalactosaminyltransferase
MPYGFGSLTEGKKGPIITINYKRVVEVWMDPEYKEFFYTREPMARYTELGDITEQLKLKERLQCKSFDWFMNNIAYDMLEEFPKLPKVIIKFFFLSRVFFFYILQFVIDLLQK